MSRDTIRLPHDAYRLLQTLRAAGHSAYVVGGCVRDSLLGRLPGDWDICTSARPDEMKALFCSQRLILTGEKHGTVAVILHGKPYEMTTYRLDGSYRDHRHPDNVQFVDDVAADLARRDFTINAMAYAPGEGVIDLYGGRSDLAARVVRCVGTPADRFAEDALRILRALRFSAKLGFALCIAQSMAFSAKSSGVISSSYLKLKFGTAFSSSFSASRRRRPALVSLGPIFACEKESRMVRSICVRNSFSIFFACASSTVSIYGSSSSSS